MQQITNVNNISPRDTYTLAKEQNEAIAKKQMELVQKQLGNVNLNNVQEQKKLDIKA